MELLKTFNQNQEITEKFINLENHIYVGSKNPSYERQMELPIEMYTIEQALDSLDAHNENAELISEILEAKLERLELFKALPAEAFIPLNPQFSFESQKEFAENSKKIQIGTSKADITSVRIKLDSTLKNIEKLNSRIEELKNESESN